MRLTWNEIRARAARFAKDWQDAALEKGETQSFYNDFFKVFGVNRRSVARFEAQVAKLNNNPGYIDLFWPGVLIVEQKSAGRDLKIAFEQVQEYSKVLSKREQPRYILVSDFQTFELYDLDENDDVKFKLADLPANVESFGFILGVQRRVFRDQDPVNIEAAELIGRLYDELAESGQSKFELERFLVRIVFCMFADDTGVFEPRDIFLDYLEERTKKDGTDLGPLLMSLFDVLNTPESHRVKYLDDELARFPYVDGDLFQDKRSEFSRFTAKMREYMLNACRFDWSSISPAIFGALFQSVMNPKERREQGAHYTTEKNILKVIEPLFMDDLHAEFNRIAVFRGRGRLSSLRKFQAKLGNLTFLDPACGCGNFLIIAYRELRMLEIEVIKEIRLATSSTKQTVFDTTWQSVVDVDQFYGIEIGEFPVRIAETALWMMDHIMNNVLSLEFGQSYVRIPLEKSPHIVQGDALETAWSDLLPSNDFSFILGNPPFVGAKYQNELQRTQVREIANVGNNGGTLDYVAAWLIKAGKYINGSRTRTRIGFVTTNSITQGEQVAQLWPVLFERYNLELSFAHRTFAWGSDARGKARVHVVIVGLESRKQVRNQKRLFNYSDPNGDPEESRHTALSPYLFDAGKLADPNLVVKEENTPINTMKKLIIGSKPIDGGNYIFDEKERMAFLNSEPEAIDLLRPYIGSHEYLHESKRWILALHDVPAGVLARLPHVKKRISAVQTYRKSSKSVSTRQLSSTPSLYHVNVLPAKPFLVILKVSSERREYVPIGWLEPPVIPSDLLFVLQNATLEDFALLTSAMHTSWLRYVGGRLESRYRYSIGLVYNTFPLPPNNPDLSKLKPKAQAVLEARAVHASSTLADLYNPVLMPPNLRRAHQALDRVVDKLYRGNGFGSELERVEYLFTLYEKIQAPLEIDRKPKRRKQPVRRK